MGLDLQGEVQLPSHQPPGGFDHGDVHPGSGRVYVAHTANGTVEVIDGERLEHLATIGDCAEASGVLCPAGVDLVFAAAREAGHVLVILDPTQQVLPGSPSVAGPTDWPGTRKGSSYWRPTWAATRSAWWRPAPSGWSPAASSPVARA